VPHLGYDKAAELAKAAYATGRTVRAVAQESGLLEKTVIDQVLGPPPSDE
jgi:aspartate ammonia-lyase